MCIYFLLGLNINIRKKLYNNIEKISKVYKKNINVYIETTIKKTRQLICRCFVQNTEKINFYKTECVFVFLYLERELKYIL